jgi:hypothetical protein
MDERAPRSSALADYHAVFGNSFDLRRLWRDRRAILAQPRIASEVRPPLGFPPLRFALTLAVVPMLAIGWLTSEIAGFLYFDEHAPTPVEARARAIEAPLAALLDGTDRAQLRAWAAIDSDALPPAAADWYVRGKRELTTAAGDPVGLAAASARFVADLRSSEVEAETRNVVAAKLLRRTRALRRVDAVTEGFKHSLLEGGLAMQAIGALGTLLSAWMFRRLVRRDSRFPRAGRADQLYLYYATSRLFWLTLASIASYGALAFASASDDIALLGRIDVANAAIGTASLAWLLLGSAAMARALREDDELPAGAVRSLFWRLLASQLLAYALLVLIAVLIGVALGAATGYWSARF